MRKLFTLTLLSVLSLNAHATVWYVKTGATGTNNGTSWANAFPTLQAGIAATTAGDTIWVANGTYKPTTATSRSASFVLPSGVALFGGFAGTETSLSQRNFSSYQTILSGDINQPGIHTDDVYNVVTANAVSSATRLDGFKIIYGRADGSSSSTGGGLYCVDGSPTIANCFFTENYATGGGALRQANSGTLNVLNCTFTNNTASGYGGAIYVGSTFTSGTVVIRNCNISGNQAGDGGGCYFYTGVVTVDRCVISGNTVSGYAGAIYEDDPTLTVSNTLIVGNTAPNFAVHYQDLGNSYPTGFINCTIAHNRNTAATTGNSFLLHLHPTNTVRNCIAWGNGTEDLSIYTPTVSNSILQGGYDGGTGAGLDSLDPHFVNPAIAAQAPFTAGTYDYHLTALSHAIDTGVNSYLPPLATLDLDGNTRIQNSRVDLGAYESNYCSFTPTVVPAGNAVLCPGSTLTLTTFGGTGYLWSTGATTPSAVITAAGSYLVTAVNGAGCRGAVRKVVTASSTSVTINGSPVLCPGDTMQLTTTGNNVSWLWNTGANTSGIAVTGPGFYKVTATGADGCTVRDSITVTAGAVPQPLITNTGGVLKTGVFSTYQWQLNGTNIPGATSQTYVAAVNGTYTVRVTSVTGCKGTSAPSVVTNAGIRETAAAVGIRLFPNPARDEVRIQWQKGITSPAGLALYDQTGRLLERRTLPPLPAGGTVRVPLADYPAGTYFLHLTTEDISLVFPLYITGK